MASRFSHTFFLLIAAGIFISGCKGSATDPGTTNNTNIGDAVPTQHSNYTYYEAGLDMKGNIIPGTKTATTFISLIDTTGLQVMGKSSVYLVLDEGGNAYDTSYYSYEANSDVSFYLLHPGFLINHGDGERIDETLQAVAELVFHNWITLPIASKNTLHPYDATPTIDINGGKFQAMINTVTEYIGDSSLVTARGQSGIPDTVAAKHCRLTITAKIDFLSGGQRTLTHTRDIWFVPKIGYIAMLRTRTYIPEYTVQLVSLDTTATLKEMTNYTVN